MSHLWKKVQDKMVDEKTLTKKSINIVLVPSQRHLLPYSKVPKTVMGLNNCAQIFIGSNYLDEDSPFRNI